MKKIILFLMFFDSLYAVQVDLKSTQIEKETPEAKVVKQKPFFGTELFNGNFKQNRQFRQNSNYVLNVNDKVSVKMWGAYNYIDNNLTIDKQGNVFVPEVGAIHLLGLPAKELQQTVKRSVQKVFNKDVHVYADIQGYQPISVFVTGSVQKVGLYEGLSTDSILQFIDKAGGVIRGTGSFRQVELIRNKQYIRQIDLYDFLLTGDLENFQFRDGDTLFVKPMKSYVDIEGDVARPYIFELLNESSTVQEIIPYVLPSVKANSFTITRWQAGKQSTNEYALDEANSVTLYNGDKIAFVSNYYTNSISIDLEGEHKGKHKLAVTKGTTLYDVLSKVNYTDLSDIKNIKIYKKRVALVQKTLLESRLKELEQSVLTTDSASSEEAEIRASEAARVLQFVAKARQIQPKGQLVFGTKSNLSKIVLEEGDQIVVPSKSNFVVVEGEVNIPNALIYKKGENIDDYIELSGGYSERADKSKVLLVKANGRVLLDTSSTVEPGDSILVLRKVDSKNTIWVKDITQILYQIAVGAAVVLKF